MADVQNTFKLSNQIIETVYLYYYILVKIPVTFQNSVDLVSSRLQL